MENYKTIINCDGQEVKIPLSMIEVIDGVEYFTCPECGDKELLTEAVVVEDGRIIDASCADWSYSMCSFHNRYESLDDTNFYTLPNGERVCEQALEESDTYTRCGRCGSVIEINAEGTHYDDEETENHYCESCWRTIVRQRNNFIKHYHEHKSQRVRLLYGKNEPKNRRDTVKFGLEIEVDRNDGDYENNEMAKEINKIMNKTEAKRVISFERDGSLNYGFEMVSEALSMEFIKEMEPNFKAMFKALRKNGYKAHDVGTCGLHIHLTRSVLGDEGIANFCYFVENNRDDMIKFSRRRSSQLSSYASFYFDSNELNHDPNAKATCMRRINHSSSRYRSVNVQNSATIELRIMRGTLNPVTFFATIGFVNALAEFSMAENVTEDTDIKTIVDYAKAKGFYYVEEMEEYCKTRGIKGFETEEVAE